MTTIDGIPLKGRWTKDVRITVDGIVISPGPRAKPWAHNANCSCEAHETFTCDQCGRRVGWCLGSDDNMPGACDFCWRPPKDDP
jgi:hypothetical protein